MGRAKANPKPKPTPKRTPKRTPKAKATPKAAKGTAKKGKPSKEAFQSLFNAHSVDTSSPSATQPATLSTAEAAHEDPGQPEAVPTAAPTLPAEKVEGAAPEEPGQPEAVPTAAPTLPAEKVEGAAHEDPGQPEAVPTAAPTLPAENVEEPSNKPADVSMTPCQPDEKHEAPNQPTMSLKDFTELARANWIDSSVDDAVKNTWEALPLGEEEEDALLHCLLEECKQHPRLQEHIKYMQEAYKLDADEWTFADPEGDILCDFVAFVAWLIPATEPQQVPQDICNPLEHAAKTLDLVVTQDMIARTEAKYHVRDGQFHLIDLPDMEMNLPPKKQRVLATCRPASAAAKRLQELDANHFKRLKSEQAASSEPSKKQRTQEKKLDVECKTEPTEMDEDEPSWTLLRLLLLGNIEAVKEATSSLRSVSEEDMMTLVTEIQDHPRFDAVCQIAAAGTPLTFFVIRDTPDGQREDVILWLAAYFRMFNQQSHQTSSVVKPGMPNLPKKEEDLSPGSKSQDEPAQEGRYTDILVSTLQDMAQSLFEYDRDNGCEIEHRLSHLLKTSPLTKIASACSGTGSFETCYTEVLRTLLHALDIAGEDPNCLFAVEIQSFKQKFLQQNLDTKTCLFEDHREMFTKKRSCITHNVSCDLPTDIDILMSGFSCTSYSSLNNQSHLNLNAVQESKAVASVDTFKGCVGLIRYTRPRLFLLENVPRIDAVEEDQSSSNLDQCLAILRNVPRLSKEDTGPDLCYSVKPFLMNTLWYGLPQNRERVYVVGVKTSGDELGVHPDVYLERVQLYLSKMYVNPPSPDELLFDDDHPAVLAELERLQKVRSNNGLSTGASSDKSQNWVKMHMNLAEKRGIPWPIKPPDSLASSPWYQSMPGRMREVLSLAALDSQKKDADVAYADVYHSATRFNTGPKTHIPIALP